MNLSKIALILITVIGSDVSSYASELATILGTPNGAVDSIDSIIQKRIELVSRVSPDDASTWVYSILKRLGIKTSTVVTVVNEGGFSTEDLVGKGIENAVSEAPVIFSMLGPSDNDLCRVYSKFPHTAFVVVAGNGGVQLDPSLYEDCRNDNILFVNAWNQYTGKLLDFTNYGPLIRIAAPSADISVIGVDGISRKVTNTVVGASQVAARIALFANDHPSLQGAELIEQFLSKHTVYVPALEGMVKGARALKATFGGLACWMRSPTWTPDSKKVTPGWAD